jgi:hypothetical protein
MRQPKAVTTRSGRASKLVARWTQAMITMTLATTGTTQPNGNQVEGELFCQELLFPIGNDALYSFKTSTDPTTMYLRQAMKEPNRELFKEAMLKEARDQTENKTFTIVSQDSVQVMLTVWQMKKSWA